MLPLFLIFLQVCSYLQETIPKTEAPPARATYLAAVYDETTNEIITIGGDYYQSSSRSPKITAFSLKTQKFRKIICYSDVEPKALSGHALYLSKDRKIYEFGYSSEIYSFNLESFSWKIEELKGDPLEERKYFGYTSFSFNSTDYVAIFGGLQDLGYNNDLFLIDFNSFYCKKIKPSKDFPSPSLGITLVYFNGSLYLFGYSPLKEPPHSKLFRFDLTSYSWEVLETTGQVPDPRVMHYAVVYNDEMYVIYGVLYETISEYDSIYKYNFYLKTWVLLSNESGTRVNIAAGVLVGSKYYLFYGRTTVDVMNSVISLDLSQVPPKREVVSPDFLTPEARTYHCSVVIGTFMYTFGGGDANTDDNEKFYNDLWQFDFLSSRWTFINSLGEIPSKRKNFGCSKSFGDVFAVFGGIGEDGFLGDFYFFHESFKTWHRIQADLFPSARSGACLTYHNYRYFVIGGKNSEKGFNEIWMYLVESNRFLLMDEPIFKDGNDIYDAKCWVDEEGENPEIVLVGGCNFLNVPNAFTIRARVFYQNNTCLVNQNYKNKNDNMPLVVAAGSVLVKNEDSLFIVGGVLFDYIMTCPIRVKNLKTNEYSKYDTPNHLNIYGATGVHYKKSFYIFSGGGASDTFKSSYQLSSNIYKITFNSSDSFSLPCSEGHQIEKCIPCPQGTYSNNGSCKSCPKGRYSKTLAATSIEQCQPCAAGSFSSKEGSFHCFDCPVGYTCPIGSSEPKVNFELPQNNSVQPKAYENKKPFISFIVVNLWYSLAGVAVFSLVICLIFSGVWRKIKDLDIFVSYHSSDLGKPVVHRKTRIGGVFSVLFEIASIITVIAAFLSFQMDNVSEIKTLIPIMILDERITAKEITVTSTFYIYGGECSYEKMCNPNIIYEDSGLSYTFRSISCTTLNENCEIKAKYTNLELSSKTSEIQLKLKEKSSYSSSISVNITSTSSIPNQISSIFTSFTTGSTETLFRGTTGSKVYFKFTPSVKIIQLFTSESSDWASKETGFHVSSPQEPERGSLSTRSTVNIQIHLLLNIVILESDTAMKTIRTLNQSIFVFLGALLGSIFGLMGTFSTVMGYTEAFLEKVENKRKKISHVNEMKSRLGVLKAEFGKWVVLRRSKKVVPIDTAQSVIITCQ